MQSSVSYYKYNNAVRQYLLKDEDFKNFNVDAKNTIKINSYAVGVNLGVKYTF